MSALYEYERLIIYNEVKKSTNESHSGLGKVMDEKMN